MRVLTLLALLVAGANDARAQSAHQAPATAPSRATITDSAEQGARLSVSGRVLGSDGRPIPGASLYVYQTDANGEYVRGANGGGSDRPRLFAYLRSDAQGRYAFSTIKPGSYPNSRNPGHIHFEVMAPGYETRIYEIVFENDPYLSAAFRAQARQSFGGVAIVEPARATGGLLHVVHDVSVKLGS